MLRSVLMILHFSYRPTTMTGRQQQAFSGTVDSCFKDLQFARFQYSPIGGEAATSATMALLIDDVRYSTINKTCS